MHLIALPLPDALALLASQNVAPERIQITETTPPRAPRHFVPIWGELRVIRAHQNADETWELLVARELLREEKLPERVGGLLKTKKSAPNR